ncbi:MAG: LacI family transcriptional regulator [Propionibacteriaceae bacterium]|jgi:LacI family transcriptional regulator|nr:LacI family transcriptional regulator [Propionibacteriaceae bacterium]
MTRAGGSITIEDVARAAGVSRAAVSKVIRDAYGVSPAMKARVQAAIDQLGYRPRISARAMRGASYTLGVEIPNIHNYFFPKIIDGAIEALTDTPYQLILAPTGAEDVESPEAIDALVDHQVDGIISIGSRVSLDYLEDVADRLPLVTIGRHYRSEGFDTVASDDRLGARLAIRHLYELGHRRIVHATLSASLPAMTMPDTPHRIRLEAYRAEMARLGLSEEVIESDPTEEAAQAAGLRWLPGIAEPVGVFAAHDELALGLLGAAAELGRGPDLVSVVGYDDQEFIAAEQDPPLTTIGLPHYEMGRWAMEESMKSGANRSTDTYLMPCSVVPRASVGSPSVDINDRRRSTLLHQAA